MRKSKIGMPHAFPRIKRPIHLSMALLDENSLPVRNCQLLLSTNEGFYQETHSTGEE